MAFRTGIANGYRDLLFMLYKFVTSYKMINNQVYTTTNVEHGYISAEWANDDSGVVEDSWTVLLTVDSGGTVTFTVTGADSSHGLQTNTGIMGTPYVSDGGEIGFTLIEGDQVWVTGDTITFDSVVGQSATQAWTTNRYNMVYDTDIDYSGVPNNTNKGRIGNPNYDMNAPGEETWTLTCLTAASSGTATFSVSGSTSGSPSAWPACTSGVAYDNDIVSFLITEGVIDWEVGDVITFEVPMAREIFFEAPGNAGAEQIYTMIRTYEDLSGGGDDIYQWQLNGATGFVPETNFFEQPNSLEMDLTDTDTVLPRCCQQNREMVYWIVANGRRVMMFYEVDTVIESLHLGLILAYALPSEDPYTLAVGGTTVYPTHPYTSSDKNHRGFYDPMGTVQTPLGSTLRLWQQQTPMGFGNYYSDGLLCQNLLGTNYGVTWPFVQSLNSSYTSSNQYWKNHADTNIDGSLPLYPIIPWVRVGLRGCLGEFQGLYATKGGALNNKDTSTIGGYQLVFFKNVHLDDRYSWVGLKME